MTPLPHGPAREPGDTEFEQNLLESFEQFRRFLAGKADAQTADRIRASLQDPRSRLRVAVNRAVSAHRRLQGHGVK